MPQINAAGLALIKESEGCVLSAYLDAGGVCTIGYGHTGTGVMDELTITQAQANTLLEADLREFEQCVNDAVSHSITPNQFAALVSFAYNVGCEALRSSTLLRLLNEGDVLGAADQFGEWVNDDGKPLPGLVQRRAKERALFLEVDA